MTISVCQLILTTIILGDAPAVDIGSKRELFVDRALIDRMDGASLVLHEPRDEGPAFPFDKPWEGAFCGYATLIKDGDRYMAYYRGLPTAGKDGSNAEVTCVATSKDGIHWDKPKLDVYPVDGEGTNIVLAEQAPLSHNFCPFLDARPGCPSDQRFKAIAGVQSSGLHLFASEDGMHWKPVQEDAVLPRSAVPYDWMFDSQNLAFWSDAEKKYLLYFRIGKDGIRRIARSESDDMIHWSDPVLMEYENAAGSAPIEQLYTNQTSPYFRAPHISVSVAARFMPGRQVLTDEEAKTIGVDPRYFKDTSDAIFMTTRGGGTYWREFMEGFIRPGIGPHNWVSRTNYPALNLMQTSPTEMSLYVNQDYAQPTSHLRRYSLRLDGFSSARAPYEGGELVTRPLTFKGDRLYLNFATSAAGRVQVELLDSKGEPIPGYALDDCPEIIGNEIERAVRWRNGNSVGSLQGSPVAVRFVLKDADVYSFRFAGE